MDKALIGTWRKMTTEACANQYPDVLQFLEAGVYMTEIPNGEFRYWQSGDYETENRSRVKIQTANDRMQSYEYSIDSDGRLKFLDERMCEIIYIKSG